MKTDLHELAKELLGAELADAFADEAEFSISEEKYDISVRGLDIAVPKLFSFKLQEFRVHTKGVVYMGLLIYLGVQVASKFEVLWQGIP